MSEMNGELPGVATKWQIYGQPMASPHERQSAFSELTLGLHVIIEVILVGFVLCGSHLGLFLDIDPFAVPIIIRIDPVDLSEPKP
jgi:hypothetical protein